ncbi:MAGUK p55 subfamily member 4-like [Nothobranchius furzeri]|uniref:MAGUK p55 subfamily member 4-like n=1 Tax=Nothobranchius furzeri TaxID=105023 RepID=A0A9D2Y8X3_NOTFU|nr:MAGUK p55 subfamily member 4-like [Nothobranchius furzeri]
MFTPLIISGSVLTEGSWPVGNTGPPKEKKSFSSPLLFRMLTMRQSMEDEISGMLSSVVEDISEAVNRNISGAQLLHELLSAPWLRSLLRIYECLMEFQRIAPSPFLPYASGLSEEALLSSHDSVAQSDYLPVLPPLPDELPEDEEAMRIVCLVKNNQPLGATIKRNEESGDIYVARVIHGGLADRSGLLFPGDVLVEVNGNSVAGLEPGRVIQILTSSKGTVLLKVIPNSSQVNSRQKPVYMRAMVDYRPQQDSSIPCPVAGMSFSRGDLLEVVDQSDGQWWQARKLPCGATFAGLIPSASMLKSKQREQWFCQPLQVHTCIRPSGFRRSFRLWRRTWYKKRRQSCTSCSPSSNVLSSPYEEVALYQRLPQESYRLIVLIGASGVGVNELRKRLIKLNPSTFQGPVPYTTRPMKEGELAGREYHFVTKELFEYMLCNNKFVEYGEGKGHMYGMSIDAVDEVLKKGQMCIIDVEPPVSLISKHLCLSLEIVHLLRCRNLKPYVIFIKAPNQERLRQTRRNARIITNYAINRAFTVEDLLELEETSQMIEAKYKQYFDSTVVNDDLQDACMQLCSIIQQAQNEPQWIPVSWLRTDE